jgi:predicted secreted hydrolase
MVGYNTANIRKRISLPKDIGPHSLTDVEWWYYFAFLNGEHGGKYAVMGAFYQAGELPILKGHYLIFSLINLSKCSFQSSSFIDKRFAENILYINTPVYLLQCPNDENVKNLWKYLIQGKLPAPHHWLSHASIEKAPKRLLYDNSSMIFKDTKNGQFEVTVSGNGAETSLVFNSLKPVSLIGETGKPDKLYYYSFPRNKVKGYIKKNHSTEYVTGEGWFDHQWGYRGDLITKTGWNWFGLQLEDGRELLINEFRAIKTGDTFSPMANLIEHNGELKFTRNLTLQPSNYWKSPLTNAIYPLNWIITIPEFNMTINISAVFKEQEMPVIAPLNAIWEGVCSVSGKETKPNRRSVPLTGKGFLELVGYANYKC